MNDKDLKKYIGLKIKEFRVRKNLTQKELGEKLGVKNNTISGYERGIISPLQDALFTLANILDVKVDDFFPPTDHEYPVLNKLNELSDDDFDVEDMEFFRKLVEKTLSLDKEEREKFLENIKFTVEFYDRNTKS